MNSYSKRTYKEVTVAADRCTNDLDLILDRVMGPGNEPISYPFVGYISSDEIDVLIEAQNILLELYREVKYTLDGGTIDD